jgi:hypothetical protein
MARIQRFHTAGVRDHAWAYAHSSRAIRSWVGWPAYFLCCSATDPLLVKQRWTSWRGRWTYPSHLSGATMPCCTDVIDLWSSANRRVLHIALFSRMHISTADLRAVIFVHHYTVFFYLPRTCRLASTSSRMSVCWGIGNAATARRSALASYCLACMRCVHTPHEQEPRKLEALSRRTAIDTSWLRGAHRWSIDSSRLDRMGTTTIDQQGRICLLPGGKAVL